MSEAAIMISLRLVHIISGALWVGAILLLAAFLVPAVRSSGAGGAQVMQELVKRRFHVYMGALPALVVLSGFTMYLRLTILTHGAFARTPVGIALGTGGSIALVALIIGGAVVGRTVNALTTLGAQLQTTGGPPSPAQHQEVQRLQARLAASAKVVSVLVLVTTSLMATARYLSF
jgi:uncharacterized membrane protein